VEWSDTQGQFADPDWSVVCQLPVDAKVTSVEKQERVLAAHSSEGPSRAAPQFRARTSTAVAEATSEQVELLFAEAVAPHAGRFLRTRFSAQGQRGQALAEWESILRSIREEA
jgi:hypothetical protein